VAVFRHVLKFTDIHGMWIKNDSNKLKRILRSSH
jgi:hypothetical protein